MKFAFLVGRAAIGMECFESLIAAVGQHFELRRWRQAGAFEEGKVVSFAGGDRDAQNLLRNRIDHALSFLGVALFLSGVAATLFFWGRSMRCSLASTTITVRSREPSCRAFLPGR